MPSTTAERSNGFIPLPPLRHDEPTAVGLWDLESRETITRQLEIGTGRARDQLVLARLHGQPLALLHTRSEPGRESHDELIGTVWLQARDEILRHVRECACLPTPGSAAELDEALAAADGECPQLTPPRPPGRATVIICTIGQQAMLVRVLESLLRMSCGDFDIIVVDNRPAVAGTRETVERLGSLAPIRYVAEPRPGLATARNAGVAAAADAEYVVFTDDDVVTDPGWLAWLLAPFREDGVQAVTGLVLPLSLGSPAEKRFELYAGFGKGVARETYDLGEHAATDRFLYPYWGGMFGSGNSMAFRRSALLAVGGFDPALGAGTPTGGGEDIAAFSDVILAGGRLVYEPRSLCWHEHRGDEQALCAQVRNYGIGLTAVLWRYLTSDRRFSVRLVRSLPSIAGLAASRSADRAGDRLPADLARLEQRGRLLGPWRYSVGKRRARASAGRPRTAGPDTAVRGAAGEKSRQRRPETDQAGAQTRT